MFFRSFFLFFQIFVPGTGGGGGGDRGGGGGGYRGGGGGLFNFHSFEQKRVLNIVAFEQIVAEEDIATSLMSVVAEEDAEEEAEGTIAMTEEDVAEVDATTE